MNFKTSKRTFSNCLNYIFVPGIEVKKKNKPLRPACQCKQRLEYNNFI